MLAITCRACNKPDPNESGFLKFFLPGSFIGYERAHALVRKGLE